MNMIQSLEAFSLLYKVFLGRALSDLERQDIVSRHGNVLSVSELVSVAREVANSEEFFHANRETLLGQFFPAPCVVAAKSPLGDELFTDLRQLHLGFAIATGCFEPAETAFVRRFIRRGFCALDIGANIGYFTMILARLVGNEGHVVAFEPVSDSYHKLQAALSRSGMENIVSLRNHALGAAQEEMEISYARNSSNMGGAHFVTDNATDTGNVRERVVVKRLDDCAPVRNVDFIKIDVEGAEWLVVTGGLDVFRDQSPTVLMEFNRAQLEKVSRVSCEFLLDRMMELEYSPYLLDGQGTLVGLSNPFADLAAALSTTGIANLVFQKPHSASSN